MIEDAVGAVALLDNFRFRVIPLAAGKSTICPRLVTESEYDEPPLSRLRSAQP